MFPRFRERVHRAHRSCRLSSRPSVWWNWRMTSWNSWWTWCSRWCATASSASPACSARTSWTRWSRRSCCATLTLSSRSLPAGSLQGTWLLTLLLSRWHNQPIFSMESNGGKMSFIIPWNILADRGSVWGHFVSFYAFVQSCDKYSLQYTYKWSACPNRPGTLHDFRSHEIADQLTLLDAELFYKIEVQRHLCVSVGWHRCVDAELGGQSTPPVLLLDSWGAALGQGAEWGEESEPDSVHGAL